MSTRRVADVVFCLDASASMQPCIQAVRRHIGDFVRGLHSDPQAKWDVRLDFVAHSASEDADATVFRLRSLHNESAVGALYGSSQSARFFTTDVEQFSRALDAVEVGGDEAPLVALDTCLDFPWRDAAECHRVVILMTDEPLERGVLVSEQLQSLPTLIDKIQKLRVMLFVVAPPSDGFSRLSATDKCEYEEVAADNDGLVRVDFHLVLSQIGKSVSVASRQGQHRLTPVPRGLFGQAQWSTSDRSLHGR